jgi:hypothetical protein
MSSSSVSSRSAFFFLVLVLASALARAQTQTLFFQPPLYTAPRETVTADFNQDGKPDLVNVKGTVLLGNGDGTFQTGTPLTLNGITPTLIVTADFNGDGKPDILLMGSATLVYVFLGKGDGTFEPPVSTNTGSILTAIFAADVNGDGKADILALGPFGSGTTLWEFLGNGDGTFAAGVQILNFTSIGAPLVLGDFNGDGKVDVEISNGTGVEVLLGNGNGTFRPPTITTLPSNLSGASVFVQGDFNGDHQLDLFLALQVHGSSEGFTLLGNGDGTFQPPVVAIPQFYGTWNVGSLGFMYAAADLNGDGKSDLAIQVFPVYNVLPFVEIFLSNGDGTFAAGDSYFQYGSFQQPYGSIQCIDDASGNATFRPVLRPLAAHRRRYLARDRVLAEIFQQEAHGSAAGLPHALRCALSGGLRRQWR